VSQFESCTSPLSDSGENTDTIHSSSFTRNSQGLFVRARCKSKKQKVDKGNSIRNKFKYDPSRDEKIKGDPHRTVFIARLDFNTTEETLSEIFGRYGSIKSLRLIKDTKSGKSKGYAFVEFSDESEAKRAFRETKDERLLIDGREVLVDHVRAGVVPSWLPRRLGGGLGQRRKGTQRFAWKLPYFGDASPINQGEI